MKKMKIYDDGRMNQRKQMSAEQIKKCGAIWTPPEIIAEMMAKVSPKMWKDPSKTFLDPTCGAGNILVAMLLKRLDNGVSKKDAVSTLYGIELLPSNLKICHERILNIVGKRYEGIVKKNIVCSDVFKWNFEEWRPYTKKELIEKYGKKYA